MYILAEVAHLNVLPVISLLSTDADVVALYSRLISRMEKKLCGKKRKQKKLKAKIQEKRIIEPI